MLNKKPILLGLVIIAIMLALVSTTVLALTFSQHQLPNTVESINQISKLPQRLTGYEIVSSTGAEGHFFDATVNGTTFCFDLMTQTDLMTYTSCADLNASNCPTVNTTQPTAVYTSNYETGYFYDIGDQFCSSVVSLSQDHYRWIL